MGAHYWNLCLTVISSRAFRSRFSIWAGNVVLRTSILYLPGSSLMNFFGGVTPCDLPLTKISPHGDTLNTNVAGMTLGAGGLSAAAALAASAAFTAALPSAFTASPLAASALAASAFAGSGAAG